jgi:hypothetical protein
MDDFVGEAVYEISSGDEGFIPKFKGHGAMSKLRQA